MAEIQLTAAELGTTRHARIGDVIVVALDDPAPTSGYQWEVEQLPPIVSAETEGFISNPNSQLGGGGTHVFRFRVNSAGRGRLLLRRWRSWEGEASITDRFDAMVDAAP